MPTKIRKSAIELLTEAFARTHRKGRVKEDDIKTAIAALDARIKYPTQTVVLSSAGRGVLPNAVAGVLNVTTIHDNKVSIAIARTHLQSLSNTTYAIAAVTAAYTPIDAASGTLSATPTSTQSDSFTYVWSQVSGPNTATLSSTTAAAPVASVLVTGTYVFKVVITDGEGNTAEDTVDAVIA